MHLIHFDCRHFRGGIPCKPNKQHNAECAGCQWYERIETRILIIKLGAMGDVIRTTPLITAYRKRYPHCHITWLTLTPDILPPQQIDAIYPWNETSLYVLSRKKFDIAINLDKEEEACMLLAEVSAPEKYGFIWTNNHIDAATPAANHKLVTGLFDHISQQNTKHYLDEIFEICHLPFENEEYLINLSTGLADTWKKNLAQQSGGKPIIGLNTGCGNRWQTRLWPEEMWLEFIGLLMQQGYYVMVLGGPQEDEKNRRLAEASACAYPGTFSLPEFIALTQALDVVVTQVSMMMHIAVALKRKMVLMNNIFNRNEFYLYGRGIIAEPETGCDCFYGNSCKRQRSCMYDLKPAVMLGHVKQLLQCD